MSGGSAHYQILIFIENHHNVEKNPQINIYEGLFSYKWGKTLLFLQVLCLIISVFILINRNAQCLLTTK